MQRTFEFAPCDDTIAVCARLPTRNSSTWRMKQKKKQKKKHEQKKGAQEIIPTLIGIEKRTWKWSMQGQLLATKPADFQLLASLSRPERQSNSRPRTTALAGTLARCSSRIISLDSYPLVWTHTELVTHQPGPGESQNGIAILLAFETKRFEACSLKCNLRQQQVSQLATRASRSIAHDPPMAL
jgi:hypothetical protein